LKIRADEHVAQGIVTAIRDVGLSDSAWEISSVVEANQRGQADEHWITVFAKSGGSAILSADRDFFSKPPQIQAVFDTGIRVIHLPSKWGHQPGDLQAAFVLLWWSRIEQTLKTMNGRECYRPPWNLSTAGELKRINIDFQKAQKRIKRKKRRSAA
jgi:hypothetical protein